jgi:hypothetical protein
MGQLTATFDSYDNAGTRDDLVNAIYRTNTAETPFMSAIAKTKATATYHEWLQDDLGSAATNYNVEGDEATNNAFTAAARLGNYSQILDKTYVITGTQMVVDSAGDSGKKGELRAKFALQLKKDMEFALLDNNARVQGSSSTARELAGVPAWITTNYDKNGATNPTGDGTDAWSGGTDVALTEGRLKSVLQQTWASGGNPDMVVCNAFNKQVISGFSGNGTRYIQAEGNKLITSYEVYVSDFGEVKVIPSRHCETNMVYILDSSMWAMAVLRDISFNPLAKTGDFEREQMIVEMTLEARNEKANGIIVNVSAS